MKIEHKECIEKLIEELAMDRKNTKKCFLNTTVPLSYMKTKFWHCSINIRQNIILCFMNLPEIFCRMLTVPF